jgi:hypothetical protein
MERDAPPAPAPRASGARPGALHSAAARHSAARSSDPTSAVLIRSRRTWLGKWNCGPAEVSIDGNRITWVPSASHPLPGTNEYPIVSVPMVAVADFEVDKAKGGIGFWVHSYEFPFKHRLGNLFKPSVYRGARQHACCACTAASRCQFHRRFTAPPQGIPSLRSSSSTTRASGQRAPRDGRPESSSSRIVCGPLTWARSPDGHVQARRSESSRMERPLQPRPSEAAHRPLRRRAPLMPEAADPAFRKSSNWARTTM